jgi:hypothetical protein
VISDCVSLSDKLGTLVAFRRLIAEDGAVDALLPAVVDELSPNKHGVGISRSQEDNLSRPDALTALASVPIVIGTVVSLIHFQA